jgi:3-deoxy-7-phosphoheptulonate synthase
VNPTDNLRVKWTKVLVPPAELERSLPMNRHALAAIHRFRAEISRILDGTDDRLLVVVGPCSIHDVSAALEYAELLRTGMNSLASELRVVMRVYFEKPRTTVGWKGLINDPGLDESYRINDGLRLARGLLLQLVDMEVPAGTEFLDMVIPQYVAGLISWGAIGARTAESQLHRQLVSGLSCPIGFKNGTSGDVQIAIEAIQSAAHSHCFLGPTKQGRLAIFATTGNPDCHVILRGGRGMVNYTAQAVSDVCAHLAGAALPTRVMIDCSHANCDKDDRRQLAVCRNVAAQIRGGDHRIMGMMIESNLVAGAQKLGSGVSLVRGQSITDPCMGWSETLDLLLEISDAVQARRTHRYRVPVSTTRAPRLPNSASRQRSA